jgi:hypothetical protein
MFRRVLAAFTILILLLVGVACAADGSSKGNVFQVITGFMALLSGGLGTVLVGKLKLVKDLREALGASVQAFGAVQVFAKRAPESIKAVPEYVAMMTKLDTCSEEVADVLASFKATKKYAPMLRNLIQESMYVKSRDTTVEAIRNQYFEHSDILDTFDEALAELKK